MADLIDRQTIIEAIHSAIYPYFCGAEEKDALSEDEKLFAAVSQQILFLFLQISLLTKCAYPFRAIPLLPTSVGAASIALWHPPAVCGRSLCTDAGEPAPLDLSRKEKTNGEKTDRAYESSDDARAKEYDI